MWSRVFAAFHTSAIPTLRKIRLAKTQESFQSSASDLLKFTDFPQKDFVQILQSLSFHYNTFGFVHNEVMLHLMQIMRRKQDLSVFARISALEALMNISPKGKTSEYKSMLKVTLASLYESRLHELSTEVSKQLLTIVTNLRIHDHQLFDYIKATILNAAFPQGMLSASFLGALLKASAELNFNLSDLRSLVIETVMLRAETFSNEQIAHIANYLSRMEMFDERLWTHCVIPLILRQNPKKVSELALIQLHYTQLAIDFFADERLLSQISTRFPQFSEFKQEIIRAFTQSKYQIKRKPISTFHSEVAQICDKLDLKYQLEFTTASPTLLIVDILLNSGKVIEVQGPFHYIEDSTELMGKTVFKNRLLRKIGFEVIEIPYFLWGKMEETEKIAFLRDKIGTERGK